MQSANERLTVSNPVLFIALEVNPIAVTLMYDHYYEASHQKIAVQLLKDAFPVVGQLPHPVGLLKDHTNETDFRHAGLARGATNHGTFLRPVRPYQPFAECALTGRARRRTCMDGFRRVNGEAPTDDAQRDAHCAGGHGP